ncbi:hypothetical protein [Helicobacter sp. T3_23-1059]
MTQAEQIKAGTRANIVTQNLSSATMQKLAKKTQKLSSVAVQQLAQKVSQKATQKVIRVGQNLSSVAVQNLVGARFKIVGIFGIFLCFFSVATLEAKMPQEAKEAQESKDLQESKTSQESQNLESKTTTNKQNLVIDFADSIKKYYEEYAIEVGIKGECKNHASSPTKPSNASKTSTPAKQGTKDTSYKSSFTCKYPLIDPFSRFGLSEMKDFFAISDMQTRVSILNQNELKDSAKAKIIYTKDLTTKLSKLQRFFPKNFTSNSYQKITNEDFEVRGNGVLNTNDGLKWIVDMTYVVSSPYFKQKSLAEILWIVNDFSLDSNDDEKDEKCKEALREIGTKKSIFEAKITDLPKNIQAQCNGFMENLDFMSSVKIQIKELKILLDSKSVRNIIYEVVADEYQRDGKKLTQQEFINQVKQANEALHNNISLFSLGTTKEEKMFKEFLLNLADKVTNAITQNNKNTMIGFSIKHRQGQTIDIGKWLKVDDREEIESLIWKNVFDMQWQVIDK